jgi:hypothetical protein
MRRAGALPSKGMVPCILLTAVWFYRQLPLRSAGQVAKKAVEKYSMTCEWLPVIFTSTFSCSFTLNLTSPFGPNYKDLTSPCIASFGPSSVSSPECPLLISSFAVTSTTARKKSQSLDYCGIIKIYDRGHMLSDQWRKE